MEYRRKINKSVLESIKNEIYSYLNVKGFNRADFIKMNMDNVEGLYVEESDTRNLPRMQSRSARKDRPAEIMIRKSFVDVDSEDNPIRFKSNLHKLIHSQLGHELLHSGSSYDGFSGIKSRNNNRTGLNEGITQMFTEKIFGYVVSPKSDRYSDYKKVAKIFDLTFGENVMLDSYFSHKNILENKCNELSQNRYFYYDINDVLTTMYELKHNNWKKDKYYVSLAKPLYEKLNRLSFGKVCAEIVIPRLQELSGKEAKEYIKEILSHVKDDKNVLGLIEENFKKYISMNPSELNQEKVRIDKDIESCKREKDFIDALYQESDYHELVEISNDGKIHPKYDLQTEITSDVLREKILAHLFFQDNNFSEETKKKFTNAVISNCENSETTPPLVLENKSLVRNKELLSAAKYIAKENGYLVLNSIDECEQSSSIQINAIKLPSKETPFSFEDLRKVYEAYTIDYEQYFSSDMQMVVKDRNSGEKTDNTDLAKFAKFAGVWAEATGLKWFSDEKIQGITYAFNEPSEKIFNDLTQLISENMNETGSIDTKAIYESISQGGYKHSEEIIHKLFDNPIKLGIVYDFYKLQNPEALLETEQSKTTSEINGLYNEKEYIDSVADEIATMWEEKSKEPQIPIIDNSSSLEEWDFNFDDEIDSTDVKDTDSEPQVEQIPYAQYFGIHTYDSPQAVQRKILDPNYRGSDAVKKEQVTEPKGVRSTKEKTFQDYMDNIKNNSQLYMIKQAVESGSITLREQEEDLKITGNLNIQELTRRKEAGIALSEAEEKALESRMQLYQRAQKYQKEKNQSQSQGQSR